MACFCPHRWAQKGFQVALSANQIAEEADLNVSIWKPASVSGVIGE